MLKRFLILVVLAASLGNLAACGKMATPDQPEGSTFPRQYPQAQ